MSKRQDRQSAVERALSHHVTTGAIDSWCYKFNGAKPLTHEVWARTLDGGKVGQVLTLDQAEHLCLLLARCDTKAYRRGYREGYRHGYARRTTELAQ